MRHAVFLGSILWTLAACTDGGTIRDGTAVGNPGANLVPTTAAQAGVTDLAAPGAVARFVWTPCAGGATTTTDGGAVDLAGSTAFEIPDGRWCAVEMVLDGAVAWSGTASQGTVDVTLDLGAVPLTSTAGFDAALDLVLQVGGPDWLVDATADGATAVAPGDGTHDAVVASVLAASVLVEDADGSGTVDAGETVVGRAPEDDDTGDEDDDTGDDDSGS